MAYQRGDAVTIEVKFTSASGVPADPTSLTLRVKRHDGTDLAPITTGFTHPTVGTYQAVVSVDLAPGDRAKWVYRWEGVGAVQRIVEGWFHVDPTPFA